MPETTTATTTTALSGKTFLWTFEDGPTAGSTYEHTFAPDGSVSFRKMDGKAGGQPTRAKHYAAFEVSPEIVLVSYLGEESGYTLTVAMNLKTDRLYGFASNGKDWQPVSGTLEAVK